MDSKLESGKQKNLKLECYGVRHTVALMTFLGIATVYTMRTALSVAIVSMVGSSIIRRGSTNGTCWQRGSNSSSEKCLNMTLNSNIVSDGEFSWDDKTVGLVLGSFYYGYICTMFLGGRIGDYWGGRVPFGVSIFLTSVLTLLCPFAARISANLLIFVQIVRGVVDGCGFAATYRITVIWYPKQERSKFISYIFSGINFGVVISMFVSGWLCSSSFFGGWPAVFYFFGAFGIFWSILWFSTMYEDPNEHPRIQEAELKYIKQECPISKNRIQVPWRSIFTSKVVWVIAAMNFGNNWLLFTNLTQLPKYFDDVLHINIRDNGFFSALPFLGSFFVRIISGYILTYFSSRGTISLLSVRRISALISGYSTSALLIILSYLNYAPLIIITSMLAVSLLGAGSCGFMCSFGDISPRFAGTIFGLSNTLGCSPGILSPLITGFLLHYYDTEWAWKITFFIASSLVGIASTIYIFCITTKVQPWNEPTSEEELPSTISSNTLQNVSTNKNKLQEVFSKPGRNCQNSQSISEKNDKLSLSVRKCQKYLQLTEEDQIKCKLMGKPEKSLTSPKRFPEEPQNNLLNTSDENERLTKDSGNELDEKRTQPQNNLLNTSDKNERLTKDSGNELDERRKSSLSSITCQEGLLFNKNCKSLQNFEKDTNLESRKSKQTNFIATVTSSSATVQIPISSISSDIVQTASLSTSKPAVTSLSALVQIATPSLSLSTIQTKASTSITHTTPSAATVHTATSSSATTQTATSQTDTSSSTSQTATSSATTTQATTSPSTQTETLSTVQVATLPSAATSLRVASSSLSKSSLECLLNIPKFIKRKNRKVYFINN